MRAYLIDPVQRTVSVVQHDGKIVPDYDVIKLDFADCLYVQRKVPAPEGFRLLGDPDGVRYGGVALAFGHNDDGERTSPEETLADLSSIVSFW